MRAVTRELMDRWREGRVIKGLEESSLKGLESSLSERRTRAGSSQTGCPEPGPEQVPDEVGREDQRPLLAPGHPWESTFHREIAFPPLQTSLLFSVPLSPPITRAYLGVPKEPLQKCLDIVIVTKLRSRSEVT